MSESSEAMFRDMKSRIQMELERVRVDTDYDARMRLTSRLEPTGTTSDVYSWNKIFQRIEDMKADEANDYEAETAYLQLCKHLGIPPAGHSWSDIVTLVREAQPILRPVSLPHHLLVSQPGGHTIEYVQQAAIKENKEHGT